MAMSAGFRVIDHRGELLYDEDGWRELVAAARRGLAALSVKPGDRVACWMPRGWEEAALAEAVMGMGVVWVSLLWRSAPGQLVSLLVDAEPVVAVCIDTDLKKAGDGPWVGWSALLAKEGDPMAANSTEADDLAALCYTSGSTGMPKGVMVTHGNLRSAVGRLESYLHHGSDDRLLALMPLSSPWGLLQWEMARRVGAAIVLLPPVAMASELAKTIRVSGVSGLAALPLTWVQLVDLLAENGETLDSLRYVTTSGGVIPCRILEKFPVVYPNALVWMTYGLTEAFRTTVLPADLFREKMGSLGRPCEGVGIEILRPDGVPALADEEGELIHTGECVTAGYWRREEETREAFALRHGHGKILEKGPLHYSGDIVSRDAEGFLWFRRRADDLIKTGGHRVSSAEIESILLSIEGVTNAIVCGLEDEVAGHRIVAAIETQREEILAHVRSRLRHQLASHQQPQVIEIWNGNMPVTGTGKLDRPRIAAALRDLHGRAGN